MNINALRKIILPEKISMAAMQSKAFAPICMMD